MLTESFIAATLTANKAVAHASAALKDVGIFIHEFQPQSTFRHGYKKSSSQPGCVTISDSHIFAAQADKAVVNVYSRERGNHEATISFPERVHSLAFAQGAEILVLGTEGGKLILWEVATGRVTSSAASHLQAVSSLCITPNNGYIISGSADSSIHVWSMPRLVSFLRPGNSIGNDGRTNSPVRDFSAHRAGITAISCGHSTISTNFAISASDDGTCYIWYIGTGQVLRTLLLPSAVVSVAVDPADRAIYFGCSDGRIQSWNISEHSIKKKTALNNVSGGAPIQLHNTDGWTAPATDLGSTNCVALSYDGMSLLSGHTTGAIVRWDVAKHRILNEIVNLGQPVTTLEMLKPEGFPNSKSAAYTVAQITKPNLEFSSGEDNGTCGIPANYNLNAMITTGNSTTETTDIVQALTGPGIPQSLLESAVRSIILGNAGVTPKSVDAAEEAKTERLEEEIAKLKQQIAVLQNFEEKRKTRRLSRMQKKDELGVKKREAYFEAKKMGLDGDAAIKKWEEQEMKLDQESDDENLAEEMDIT